jgi:WD40 repeat protein
VWDTISGVCRQVIHDPGGLVDHVAWSPDGHSIATASQEGVRLWQPDGTLVQFLAATRRFSAGVGGLLFSRHTHFLVLAGATEQERVYVWHVRDGSLIARLGGYITITALVWGPDGRTLACGTKHGEVWI